MTVSTLRQCEFLTLVKRDEIDKLLCAGTGRVCFSPEDYGACVRREWLLKYTTKMDLQARQVTPDA